MVEIIFRPVCSACGRVLYCDVSITRSLLETSADNKKLWLPQSIEPLYCPHCGEAFESIVMPIGLPYHTNIMDNYN